MESNSFFKKIDGFCPQCGSILPLLQTSGDVNCYSCSGVYAPTVYGNESVCYTIHFNSREASMKKSEEKKKIKTEDEEEGPLVDKKCPKCGNDRMSYATVQLRSADEGQTVFYTCNKCKYKESENS